VFFFGTQTIHRRPTAYRALVVAFVGVFAVLGGARTTLTLSSLQCPSAYGASRFGLFQTWITLGPVKHILPTMLLLELPHAVLVSVAEYLSLPDLGWTLSLVSKHLYQLVDTDILRCRTCRRQERPLVTCPTCPAWICHDCICTCASLACPAHQCRDCQTNPGRSQLKHSVCTDCTASTTICHACPYTHCHLCATPLCMECQAYVSCVNHTVLYCLACDMFSCLECGHVFVWWRENAANGEEGNNDDEGNNDEENDEGGNNHNDDDDEE